MTTWAATVCARLLRCFGVATLVFSGAFCAAQDLQAVPALTAHVIDRSATLTAPEVAALEDERVTLVEAQHEKDADSPSPTLDDYSRLVYLYNKLGDARKAAEKAVAVVR